MSKFTKTSDHDGLNPGSGVLKPSKLKIDGIKYFSTAGDSNAIRSRENDPYAPRDLTIGTKPAPVKTKAWRDGEKQRLINTDKDTR